MDTFLRIVYVWYVHVMQKEEKLTLAVFYHYLPTF